MRMLIGGEWVERADQIDVINPFASSVVDTVPVATEHDIERALQSAERGARAMRMLSSFERWTILKKTADLMEARAEELSRTIAQEAGKILAEARMEVVGSIETMLLSAEEAKRIRGETIPVDSAPHGKGKIGLSLRVPCGVVVAITPFNFPLYLVCHKVGPALAAGNAVILKPALNTPLSALKLAEILLAAGLPPDGINVLTGDAKQIGDTLVRDRRVRKISFTGSRAVGEHICSTAGLKRVTLELGNNAPVVVMADADIEKAATAVTATGFANAGQVCISAQRVLVDRKVYSHFLDALQPKVSALTTGSQLDESVKVGPMIHQQAAERVDGVIKDAIRMGGRLLTGGKRHGSVYEPTVVADVTPEMRLSHDELFGPAVGIAPFEDVAQAIAMANATNYGLSASIFTQNLEWAWRFARETESGNIHVNWGPQWRAPMMPYGGLRESGFGKEGPAYAIEEMTELKMVVFHLSS